MWPSTADRFAHADAIAVVLDAKDSVTVERVLLGPADLKGQTLHAEWLETTCGLV